MLQGGPLLKIGLACLAGAAPHSKSSVGVDDMFRSSRPSILPASRQVSGSICMIMPLQHARGVPSKRLSERVPMCCLLAVGCQWGRASGAERRQ